MTAPLLLSWPKARPLTDAATGAQWTATIEPGRLLLSAEPHGRVLLTVEDPNTLRAFAMALYAAVIEHDQARSGLGPGQGGRQHLKHARKRAASPGAPQPLQEHLL
jgi:hypothetical protein